MLLALTANYILWLLLLLERLLPAPVVNFSAQHIYYMAGFTLALLCVLLPPSGVGWNKVYDQERERFEAKRVEDKAEESEAEEGESSDDSEDDEARKNTFDTTGDTLMEV